MRHHKAEWAKTGIAKRGPWAICVTCVASGKEARVESPAAQAARSGESRVATATRATATPVIYTDGACAQTGRGGYAAVIVGLLPHEPVVISGREPETTNNRMEMRAVIEGLSALDPCPAVEVVTDSEYVLKGFTQWLPGWIQSGWRTSAKNPVKNADLWVELVAAAQRHEQVTWRWTRGQSGDRFNEMADRIAQQNAAGS